MCSAYKLNKQGDNIQPWLTPFPIWNQSVVPCPVLTVASWPAYRFLRGPVRWSGIPISSRIFQFVVIHIVKGLSVVSEAEVDVFLEFPCFFYDSEDVGNLTSGSSAFSKSRMYIWKFSVHILLKPSLKDFEHNLANMWNECNCRVIEHSLALPFFGIVLKTDLFQSCGHYWVFQICWHIECSTLIASSFRIFYYLLCKLLIFSSRIMYSIEANITKQPSWLNLPHPALLWTTAWKPEAASPPRSFQL